MAEGHNAEYVVRVALEVVDSRTATNQVESTATPSASPNQQTAPTTLAGPKGSGNGKSFSNALTAQFLIESGNKLLNATGNSQISQALAMAGKYTFLGIRAFSGDPSAIAALAVDLASTALAEVRKNFTEQAMIQNEVDTARAQAGLLDLGGVKVTKHFFTGRYQYNRK